jgi:hypothetical protein
MRPAFGVGKLLDVRGIFNLPAAIEAPRMRDDRVVTVEDPHGVETRDDDERLSHVRVWDGVVVEVEADVGSVGKGLGGSGRSRGFSSAKA